MECSIIKCKCSCHDTYPQEINIKEMILDQLKYVNNSQILLFNNNDDNDNGDTADDTADIAISNANGAGGAGSNASAASDTPANINVVYKEQQNEQESLWDRRRKIHSGEIKPQTYEDVKHNFQSLGTLMQQIPNFETDADFLKLASELSESAVSKSEKSDVMPNKLCNLKPSNTNTQLVTEVSVDNTIEPTMLNPLHKYKVKERDAIIRDIYLRAHKNIKSIHPEVNSNSDEFKNYVNDEADRLLTTWMNIS